MSQAKSPAKVDPKLQQALSIAAVAIESSSKPTGAKHSLTLDLDSSESSTAKVIDATLDTVDVDDAGDEVLEVQVIEPDSHESRSRSKVASSSHQVAFTTTAVSRAEPSPKASKAASENAFSDLEAQARAVGLDFKELEVLAQIKEFNAKHHAPSPEEAASMHDFEQDFNDEFSDDVDDFDMSGMHFVKRSEQQSDNEDNEFEGEFLDDDERESASSARSLSTSRRTGSTAIVRSSSSSTIGAFMRAASQVPLLTEEEEQELAKRLRDLGDLEAARRLVMSHLRLVISVARGYTGYGLPLSDLIQEGNIGLMKAVKHFDPEMGSRLAAFAVHWVKAEIHDYVIRNWRMVKVATTKAQRKIFFNLRQRKKHLGWFTETERKEVANDLGVTAVDIAEMETRLAGSDIGFDLDEDDSQKGVSVTLSPSSYLEDENSNFAQVLENSDYATWEMKKLYEALDSLDARARYILKRRWLDETKATLQELSFELKVSIERVRQLENNALHKVKALLVQAGVNGSEPQLLEDKESKEPKALAAPKLQLLTLAKAKKALPAVKEEAKPKKRGRKKKTGEVATPEVVALAAPKSKKAKGDKA